MDLSIFFAGTGGSVPSARRGLPAVLVQRGGDRLLFDCGEGTQRQLLRSVGLAELDAVFITHFHADHWLGLPGMLKSFALRDRTTPLTIYGPRGLRELMGAMRIVYGNLPYELSIVELEPAEILERDGYAIAAVPVRHSRENCLGYVLVEDPRPGEFDVEAARALGVTPGPDFGAPAARRDGGRSATRAGDGSRAGGTQDRPLRRHGAVRGARGRGPRGRRPDPRGHLRRGGVRARPGDLPQHRPPGGASWPARRRCACWR